MSTPELIIVFAALMALIAVVTIGIDWIGKPLKNRRFISRIYRFDDEKLPVDEYGNTQLDGPEPVYVGATMAPPVPVAVPTMVPPSPARTNGRTRNPTPQPSPKKVAEVTAARGSASAFSDTLNAPHRQSDEPPFVEPTTEIAGRGPVAVQSQPKWQPGAALDATVDDRKPNLATKAERFWKTIGHAQAPSHFDADDRDRMAMGKAPRRRNPRTGKTETMQLTGLRQASEASQVRMRWPEDSVDPWAG